MLTTHQIGFQKISPLELQHISTVYSIYMIAVTVYNIIKVPIIGDEGKYKVQQMQEILQAFLDNCTDHYKMWVFSYCMNITVEQCLRAGIDLRSYAPLKHLHHIVHLRKPNGLCLNLSIPNQYQNICQPEVTKSFAHQLSSLVQWWAAALKCLWVT